MFCSATCVRGDAAADLYNQGINDFQANHYPDAAKAFQTILDSYPTFQQIDNTHILAGQSYFFAQKYPDAVKALQKEAAPDAKPEFRAQGLFLTALAQFYAAQSNSSSQVDKNGYTVDIATLTELTDFIAKNPTPDNKAFLEQTLYFRSLANYEVNNYDDAVKDLVTLTTDPQFTQSLSRPDYFLQLGDIYSLQTSAAVGDKASAPEKITGLASKAISALDQVVNDQNALVQANEGNMSKAQVYVMLAVLNNSSSEGYQKALDTYRKVQRKADLIPAQMKRLQELRDKAAQIVQQNATNHVQPGAYDDQLELVIKREQGKLDALQAPDAVDPIIEALIGISECYININGPDNNKESDEARTILHRLVAHAKLTPEQQQKVDFNILYSYVLGSQTSKASAALDDYLKKHAGDPNADSLSLQIGQKLLKSKDATGALTQAKRSITDFPKGRFIADAYTLEANALTALGRREESRAVIETFLKNNPTSPLAYSMILTRGADESADNDFNDALADFARLKDATAAGPEIQSGAHASYIQTLQKLGKFDDVVAEAKIFASKYPNAKSLPVVTLFAAQALEHQPNNDAAAVAAFQDVARKFPKDPVVAPIALFSVVDVYRKAGNLTLMLQAAKDLQATCPEAYSQILLADDAVSDALQKQRPPRFDDAAALYQPLIKASDPVVASDAQNKIGDVRFAQAKSFHYQSLPPAGTPGVRVTRDDATKALAAAESAYLATLKNSPDQLAAVGNALEGLINVAQRNRSWGVFKDDSDFEPYLSQVTKDLTSPDMQARVEMAKAGLVFVVKNGAAQYPAALNRFRKVVAANPSLPLTRQETEQFGDLLVAAKDYDTAQKLYQQLVDNSASNDAPALAVGYYGLGAIALDKDDYSAAKDNFMKLKSLPNGAVWFKHIMDADYGIAYADEQSGMPADIADAKSSYAALMVSAGQQQRTVIAAESQLGYGRILDKEGFALKPAQDGPNEYAVHYYLQPNLMYSVGTPEPSAEGLYRAGQAYDKVGDKANAKKQYDTVISLYKDSAPDWVAKAQAAEGQ